jgi:hypothetical protein
MAPKNQTAASRTAESSNTQDSNTQEELAAAQAEIERLRAILANQDTPSGTDSPGPDRLASVLEAITQRLTREDSPNRSSKSTKIPDPPILTDGKDPAFDSWKIQITGKLSVNADHFAGEQARITYVFNRTGGDAQKHLNPRISANSVDPFLSADDMIQHLSDIYEDPFRMQNARRDYRRLIMKSTETFTDFYTRFLHLAGEGRIPEEDLRPDLYDKLTLELQRAIAPTEETLITVHDLQRALRRLDQNLRQIKERSDRAKARNGPSASPTIGPSTASSGPAAREPTPGRTPFFRGATPDRFVRPQYPDPAIQALSDQGACFTCGIKGHFAKDCLQGKDKTLAIQEVETESGKESP